MQPLVALPIWPGGRCRSRVQARRDACCTRPRQDASTRAATSKGQASSPWTAACVHSRCAGTCC